MDLTTEGIKFEEYNLPFIVDTRDALINYIENNDLLSEKLVDVYLFSNKDGIYSIIRSTKEEV